MGSIKAQIFARKVSETVRGGRPFTYGKIMKDAGYSDESSKKAYRVTRTKAFKQALIVENAPLIEGIQEEINAIKNAMRAKNKNNEEYRVLAGSLDILTRNYQLLSGGATERQVFVLPSEIMNKNQIQQTKEDVKAIGGSVEPSTDTNTA